MQFCFSHKILHKNCFQFLRGRSLVPREIENKSYAKLCGENKLHYGEKSDSLGPKLSARTFVGLFGGTSRATTLNIWRDIQVVVCLSAQITSGIPLVWHFIEYQRRDVSSCVFFPVVLAPRQRNHLWSCFTVHSSGFSRGKIVPGTSSSFSFTFSCFIFSLPPSVLLFWAVLTPLKHSTSLSAMFVYASPQVIS